jgi:hypothetical protein
MTESSSFGFKIPLNPQAAAFNCRPKLLKEGYNMKEIMEHIR